MLSSAISTDENCLYVDVYTPAGTRRGSLPVLVHIHGGGFLGGSDSVYDKTELASQGHMVVVGMEDSPRDTRVPRRQRVRA